VENLERVENDSGFEVIFGAIERDSIPALSGGHWKFGGGGRANGRSSPSALSG
jgi:hypothetical protein